MHAAVYTCMYTMQEIRSGRGGGRTVFPREWSPFNWFCTTVLPRDLGPGGTVIPYSEYGPPGPKIVPFRIPYDAGPNFDPDQIFRDSTPLALHNQHHSAASASTITRRHCTAP